MMSVKEVVAHLMMQEQRIESGGGSGVVTVQKETIKSAKDMILAQSKELELLRNIFSDMVGMSDVLHAAAMQERTRCLKLIKEIPYTGSDWYSRLMNAVWEGKDELE